LIKQIMIKSNKYIKINLIKFIILSDYINISIN